MPKREIELKLLKSAVNAVLDHLVEDLDSKTSPSRKKKTLSYCAVATLHRRNRKKLMDRTSQVRSSVE
jgi:hypothetical protein